MCKYNQCPSCCDLFVLAEAWNILRLNSTGVWEGRAGDLVTASKFSAHKQNSCTTVVCHSAQLRGSGRKGVLPALWHGGKGGCSVLDKEENVAFLYFCWISLHEQPHLSKHDEKWKWNKKERQEPVRNWIEPHRTLKPVKCLVAGQ